MADGNGIPQGQQCGAATVIRLIPLQGGGYEITLGVDRSIRRSPHEKISQRTRCWRKEEAWAKIEKIGSAVVERLAYQHDEEQGVS